MSEARKDGGIGRCRGDREKVLTNPSVPSGQLPLHKGAGKMWLFAVQGRPFAPATKHREGGSRFPLQRKRGWRKRVTIPDRE